MLKAPEKMKMEAGHYSTLVFMPPSLTVPRMASIYCSRPIPLSEHSELETARGMPPGTACEPGQDFTGTMLVLTTGEGAPRRVGLRPALTAPTERAIDYLRTARVPCACGIQLIVHCK